MGSLWTRRLSHLDTARRLSSIRPYMVERYGAIVERMLEGLQALIAVLRSELEQPSLNTDVTSMLELFFGLDQGSERSIQDQAIGFILQDLEHIFAAITAEGPSFAIVIDGGDDALGRTNPRKRFGLRTKFGPIHLNPYRSGLFNASDAVVIRTLLHEASHRYCGTSDLASGALTGRGDPVYFKTDPTNVAAQYREDAAAQAERVERPADWSYQKARNHADSFAHFCGALLEVFSPGIIHAPGDEDTEPG